MTHQQFESWSSGPTNVLLVGGGGREHALAWKIRESPLCRTLFATHTDNPGIAALSESTGVPLDLGNPFQLRRFCEKNGVGLVVIGPEDPLAAGLADALSSDRTVVFGPGKLAARLEADKSWCKQITRGASVPMAEGRSFSDYTGARAYVETRDEPVVVKASGLAKGKGVVVSQSIEEALDAVDAIMRDRKFGDAGSTIVVEERLEGHEVSIHALVDGRSLYVLEPAKDYKRLGDGDAGPNTGGMGSYSPGGLPTDDEALLTQIERDILVPTVDSLRREGIEYRGVLYAGLMLTAAGPKLLEYNVRFGDPETQVLMRRWKSDFLEAALATATGALDAVNIQWDPSPAVCLTLASGGYPESPETGKVIEGIDEAEKIEGVRVFHAGTKRKATGELVSAGGRVLSVTAVGQTLEDARARAYRGAELIRYEGKALRTDIADVQ